MSEDYSVVWWDPQLLETGPERRVGVRAEAILVPPSPDDAQPLDEGRAAHEAWRTRRDNAKDDGEAQSHYPFSATEALYEPPGYEAHIEVVEIEKLPDRPSGARFGRLVHSILRDIALDVQPEALAEDLAKIHGRVLGATDEEISAAATPVVAALAHPLVDRARRADRCHREYPVMTQTADGSTLEGEIDLVFLEGEAWTVVDFKTDVRIEGHLDKYRRQLTWYLFAIEQATGQKARGVLLSL